MTERANYHHSSGWRCILCQTMIGNRPNALRHLCTIHQPIVHHRCSRCGICVKTDYDLRRHKRHTCHTHSSRYRDVRHCNHRQSQHQYVMLPKNYVADDYLVYVRTNESIGDDNHRQESDESGSCSELMNQDNTNCGLSSEFVWQNGPKDVNVVEEFQYIIDGHCLRVARRENDSFEMCIGKDELQSQWPCPRCKPPFRTPQGLVTHLRYMYERI